MLESQWKWGTGSLNKLNTVDLRLRNVATRALSMSPVDIIVVHGWRGEEEQNDIFAAGNSKVQWPDSKHNHTRPGKLGEPRPNSLAIDLAPYVNGEIDWDDIPMFCVVAGVMFAAAAQQKQIIRWGGDWDMDRQTSDQTFMDWGHFEIVDAAPIES